LQISGIAELIAVLRQHAACIPVEIETNGSIPPGDALISRVSLFVVSPKLGHSGNDPAIALNEQALAQFASLDSAVFKFVAREHEDIAAIAALAKRLRLTARRVYVMPEGVDAATIERRGRELIGDIVKLGFNYSDRLHIRLFGEKRGV
jgi:organic radical activating enzyme